MNIATFGLPYFSIVHICRQKPELICLKFTVILPKLESIMICIIIKWGLNQEVTVVDKAEKQWIQLFALIKPGLLKRDDSWRHTLCKYSRLTVQLTVSNLPLTNSLLLILVDSRQQYTSPLAMLFRHLLIKQDNFTNLSKGLKGRHLRNLRLLKNSCFAMN